MFERMIDLDANATTPLDDAALEAMLSCLREHHGNPSSVHHGGRQSRAIIDSSRDTLAALLRCRPHEITFTGSGTESDNLAIFGLARAHAFRGRHLVTCATEHHAVLHAFDALERHEGFEVTRLGVGRDGTVCPEALRAAMRPDTTLVSIMSANNETGVRQPVATISGICRSAGVLFHCDAVQSFGKEPIDLCLFDALSIAAHKFYGPKGVGLLYLRSGLPLQPVLRGGAQEAQRRPGTENAAAIAGMAAAARVAVERMEHDALRIGPLRDRLEARILEYCPRVELNGADAPRLWNTANITFPGSDAESLLMALDMEGVWASSGSACMVGSMQPSHVLEAMGRSPARAASSIRFSLGRSMTLEAVEAACERVGRVWNRLKA
jgi:cysteine desulfurase